MLRPAQDAKDKLEEEEQEEIQEEEEQKQEQKAARDSCRPLRSLLYGGVGAKVDTRLLMP